MCKCYHWSRFSTESSPAAPALFFFALSTSLFSSLQPPHFFFLPETLMLALPSSKTQQFRHEIPRAFDPVLTDFLMNSRRFPVPFSFPARRRRRRPGGGWRSPQAGTESAKGVATSSVAVKRIGITRSGRREDDSGIPFPTLTWTPLPFPGPRPPPTGGFPAVAGPRHVYLPGPAGHGLCDQTSKRE